ncbi:hypothetical protein YpEc11_03 [Yersinia phage vB_YpEc11]|uniref:Uncharacterized protein n=1 Tax=Yersinia phage vB_YpEc11 TaxID=3056113 RepID=A0AA51Z2P9_9CAUD|nr:hypothetical protein YpEc11_03 [Yersinia phage vB_YpEc11]
MNHYEGIIFTYRAFTRYGGVHHIEGITTFGTALFVLLVIGAYLGAKKLISKKASTN